MGDEAVAPRCVDSVGMNQEPEQEHGCSIPPPQDEVDQWFRSLGEGDKRETKRILGTGRMYQDTRNALMHRTSSLTCQLCPQCQ